MATILVVDDRPPDRLYLVTLLGYGGHCVLEADDGAAALDIVRAKRPDLVVTDLLLPGMDGFELVRHLREEPTIAATPVIVYSATYQDAKARALAETCGVASFLNKPAEPDVILRTVAKALGSAVPSLPSPQAFDRDHAQLLNEKLYQRDAALDAAHRLHALMEMGQSLTLERDAGRLLEHVCQVACETLNAATAAVGLLDPEVPKLRLFFSSGADPTARPPPPDDPHAGALGRVLAKCQPCRLRDLRGGSGDGAFLPATLTAHSFLAVPVSTPSRVLGWLYVLNKRSAEAFSDDDERLAAALAAQAGIACENSSRYELIQCQSALLLDADRRKDEFLATLAHELRNPLAPIKNALHIIGLAGGDADIIDDARRMMERQVAQMVRLVDDLLDAARISQGKLQLKKQRIELAAVVANAVDATRPLIEEMGHDLSVTLPVDPLPLDGDPVRLTQVVLNLLNNAAKYTDRGGRIKLVLERQGSDAVVSINDTGVGIAPEEMSQVFEMFAQIGDSLDRSRGGLGLGLTLVKRLVSMHGGTIETRSEGKGKGSEFVVRLPIVIGSDEDDPVLADGIITAGRRRILVVDDNLDSAESLGALLRMMGNKVQTAGDGIAAVQAAEAFQADVVLLDIGLPKINGYEACRRIREQPWGKDLLLVAITGWGQDEDRRKSHAAGFDAHMVKPVDLAALTRLLSTTAETPV